MDTQLRSALIAGVALTATLDAVYYFGGLTGVRDATPLRASAVAAAGALLAALAVWRWSRSAYARGQAASRSTALGVLAVVSFLGFWIGILGPVCAAAALFGRRAFTAGRTGAAAVGLGGAALAGVAGAVLCLLGAS